MSSAKTNQFLEAAKYRRTVYPLKDTSSVSDARVAEIVREVFTFAPSSYNTQPVRATIVVGKKHKELWDIVAKESAPILQGAGEEVVKAMNQRFEMFKAAHGSVVFWESGEAIKSAAETHKSAAHMFPQFGEHANGMHQILVWSALELEGVGANLQHMQAIPPVEVALKKFMGVPDHYSLKAHLNYGDEVTPHPEVPQKLPTDETVTILA